MPLTDKCILPECDLECAQKKKKCALHLETTCNYVTGTCCCARSPKANGKQGKMCVSHASKSASATALAKKKVQ
jgi:hypothetical protein